MRLTIEPMRGVWRAQLDSRTVIAETLEDLLAELAPDAPAAYVYHAGELLGGILGAEVVELQESRLIGYDEVCEMLFGEQGDDTEFDPLNSETAKALDEEHGIGLPSWQPTEAQQAYFNPEVEGDGA